MPAKGPATARQSDTESDSSFFQLHTLSPESMVTGDLDGNGQDELIIDFGPGFGIYVNLVPNNSSASAFQLHE